MRKYTSHSQQPGLRPDGLPNRAMKRHLPSQAGAATVQAFTVWYFVASALIPGYVPAEVEQEQAA